MNDKIISQESTIFPTNKNQVSVIHQDFNEMFLQRLSSIHPGSTLTLKQTTFQDGRVEKSVIVKPITMIEHLIQSLVLTTLLIVLFGFILFLHQIYYDISAERESQLLNATVEIAKCRDDYYQNLCDPESRVPSTEEFCFVIIEKEVCMQQSPYILARNNSQILHLIGRFFNDFFQEISFKTFTFLFTFTLLLSIVLISVFRHKI